MVKNKGDEFEVVMLKKDYSGEVRTTFIADDDGQRFNLESLMGSIKKVIEDRKEELTKIFSFGLGICGDADEARGFVMAWIVRGLMLNYEAKNGQTLKVMMETTDMTKEAVKDFVIVEMEEMITNLKENAEAFIKKLPIGGGTSDDLDVGDIFA